MIKTARLFYSTKALSVKRRNSLQFLKKRRNANPGIENRLRELSECEDENFDLESLKDDIDYREPNFDQVGQSYKMHKREMEIRKLNIKTKMTINKFIKEAEPSFLTFAEKEQIKLLHRNNPDEWTIEKLSESFPALPSTIKKVLKNDWSVKTKQNILNYDEKVAENWISFRDGELSVSPMLTKHLEKFSDRKIILSHKDELAEQFVTPRAEIPKPTSTLYLTIAKALLTSSNGSESNSNSITSNEMNEKVNQNFSETREQNEFFEEFNNRKDSIEDTQFDEFNSSPPEEEIIANSTNLCNDNKRNKRVTFDEFLESSVRLKENSNTIEDIVLKSVYKKEIEKKILFESKVFPSTNEMSEVEVNEKLQTSQTSRELNNSKNSENNKSISTLKTELTPALEEKNYEISLGSNKSSLETCVKEWHKKNIDDVEVAAFIKIPRRRYKMGMTYRVRDSFYDDDGTFLYRVPGLLDSN
ncbi:uncharacterized protein LOC122511022 [Leptopilina heterotoma]|uniref:uncharacterized protein LOC122511022 n=1 Tax=Leptopilina heterotoma TaxID=63436 RepID=UPI001CA83C6B|nr:uncharacterized protein LOC122511022 [Leptopilina heterotoma]